MDVLFWVISIHLFIYALMLGWAYYVSKSEQKKGERISVTTRTILNYWPTVCFIPIFGPVCTLTMFTVLGLDELKERLMTTKFWAWIQNILNKEI